MTMKAHTYYIIFGRPPIGGKLRPFPLAAPLAQSPYICERHQQRFVRFFALCRADIRDQQADRPTGKPRYTISVL